MERLQSGITPDLLLLDLPLGEADGLHILRWLRRFCPALPIILLGHPEDGEQKQEAIRLGARDYIVRPFDEDKLERVIQHQLSVPCELVETDLTSDDVELISDDTFFIGISPIMRKLRAQAALLAKASMPVLILGESGSGKETTARLVHKLSVRSGFEFAKVNCAALPGDLLERELFGYKRDSTAGRTKTGKLERCAGGTILLDEITEMPMRVQANLVQVLQNGRFIRPGTSSTIEVNVRVLAASTANTERPISKSKLRDDLYYHLSSYTIHVPPLRERKEEIPLLSRHLMHQLARHYGIPPREFSPAIIEACQGYSWPGNLRELENFLKRYLMVGNRDQVFSKSRSGPDNAADHRPVTVSSATELQGRSAVGSDSLKSLVKSVQSEAEKNAIAAALEETGWNRKAAARLLKVSYRTLLYKIEQYHMHSSDTSDLPEGDGPKSKELRMFSNGQLG